VQELDLDVDDARMMMESLIENVHGEDLAPIERARGIAEVYRLAEVEPREAAIMLNTLSRMWSPLLGITTR